jgi:hypothetical protein
VETVEIDQVTFRRRRLHMATVSPSGPSTLLLLLSTGGHRAYMYDHSKVVHVLPFSVAYLILNKYHITKTNVLNTRKNKWSVLVPVGIKVASYHFHNFATKTKL